MRPAVFDVLTPSGRGPIVSLIAVYRGFHRVHHTRR
jgi:hypothetical protein